MRQFNQLIGRRRLSDLSVFKIEPEDEQELVWAIEALISTAEQVDSGQSFELFDHGSVLDDESLTRAKALLIREGDARGGLAQLLGGGADGAGVHHPGEGLQFVQGRFHCCCSGKNRGVIA